MKKILSKLVLVSMVLWGSGCTESNDLEDSLSAETMPNSDSEMSADTAADDLEDAGTQMLEIKNNSTELVRFGELTANLSSGEINGLSDSNVIITKVADGLDIVYSLSIENQNFDNMGDADDSLSWDIRFKGFTGSSITANGSDSSVALGSSAQVYMTDKYFGVSDERYVHTDDSIQFSVENVTLNAAQGTTVQFNGFDGLYGSDDTYIFGVGDSGLPSLVTTDDDDFTFSAITTLTLSCPADKCRVRDLGGSFTVTAPKDTDLAGTEPIIGPEGNANTGGLKIYYIRHAEGGHNVTSDWEGSGVPEEEWPDYVGDANQFTPLGLIQMAAVSEKLQALEPSGFDFIAASDMWRTQNTILQYMKDVDGTGEVWSELRELSINRDYLLASDLPEVTVDILGEGSLIKIPSEESAYFSLRPDGMYRYNMPDAEDDSQEEAAAGKVVLQKVIDLILDRYDGMNKSVLLAGHNAHGRSLIQLLMNKENLGRIDNTGVWMVQQQPDGTFKPMIYNSISLVPPAGSVSFSDLGANLLGVQINGETAGDSNATISAATDGLDIIYSLTIENQDLDGLGNFDDSLSWDIRFKGFIGGNITLNGHDSSVTLGSSAQVHMTDSYFGVSDERYVDADDSVQFSIENVILDAAPGATVQFNGFDALYGSDDSYIFGVGASGLESLITTDDDNFTFSPLATLTLSCPDGKFRVTDLAGSFTVSAPADTSTEAGTSTSTETSADTGTSTSTETSADAGTSTNTETSADTGTSTNTETGSEIGTGAAKIENTETGVQTVIQHSNANWSLTSSTNAGNVYNAIDGDDASRWTTYQQPQEPGQFFTIDLNETLSINRLVLNSLQSANDSPRAFDVFISSDGINWGSPVASGSGGSTGLTEINFASVNTRYLKITQNGEDNKYWWSIHELNLYGVTDSSLLSSADLAANRQYSHLYFQYGYPSTDASRKPDSWANTVAIENPNLIVETGYYSLNFDMDDMTLLGYDALEGSDYVTSLHQDVTTFTPATLNLYAYVDDNRYACSSADLGDGSNVRLIESGQFVQRFDHIGIICKDSSGEVLAESGRFEVTAWPDKVTLMLDFSEAPSVTRTTIQLISPASVQHLSDKTKNITRLTLRPQDDELATAITPANFVGDISVVDSSNTVELEYNTDEAAILFDLPGDGDSDYIDYDEYIIDLNNPTSEAVNLPLVFNQPTSHITGKVMTLANNDGSPTGIPVQISKNWHKNYETVHMGSWIRGSTMIRLEAGEARTVRLRVIDGYWSGVGSASHSQLSLIGYGGNWKWDESAIGSWGETMTYDPTQHLGGAFMDDIRPAYTLGYNNPTEHQWTENSGGGDFLVYFDSNNKYRWATRLKTAYQWTGPNMVRVLYSGITDDNKIRFTYTTELGRTNDYHRRIHSFKYEFLEDVAPQRLVFMQMAAEYYRQTTFSDYYFGDASGLTDSYVADTGGNEYKGKINFQDKWLAIDDTTASSSDTRSNRGILSRKLTLNGDTLTPYMHLYGRSWGWDTLLFDLSADDVARSYQAGDVVEGEVTFAMTPDGLADYWGADTDFASRLSNYTTPWNAVYDEHRYNNGIDVSVTTGTLVRAYPIEIANDKNTTGASGVVYAQFTVNHGGIGHVPVTLTNIPQGVALSVESYENGKWVTTSDNASEHAYYQGYRNASGTIDYTFNIHRPSKDLTSDWTIRIRSL